MPRVAAPPVRRRAPPSRSPLYKMPLCPVHRTRPPALPHCSRADGERCSQGHGKSQPHLRLAPPPPFIRSIPPPWGHVWGRRWGGGGARRCLRRCAACLGGGGRPHGPQPSHSGLAGVGGRDRALDGRPLTRAADGWCSWTEVKGGGGGGGGQQRLPPDAHLRGMRVFEMRLDWQTSVARPGGAGGGGLSTFLGGGGGR